MKMEIQRVISFGDKMELGVLSWQTEVVMLVKAVVDVRKTGVRWGL